MPKAQSVHRLPCLLASHGTWPAQTLRPDLLPTGMEGYCLESQMSREACGKIKNLFDFFPTRKPQVMTRSTWLLLVDVQL